MCYNIQKLLTIKEVSSWSGHLNEVNQKCYSMMSFLIITTTPNDAMC